MGCLYIIISEITEVLHITKHGGTLYTSINHLKGCSNGTHYHMGALVDAPMYRDGADTCSSQSLQTQKAWSYKFFSDTSLYAIVGPALGVVIIAHACSKCNARMSETIIS